MKKIKLLFLMTIIITMCTGCTIEYNINITEDNIEETIHVTDNITENRTKSDIMNHYSMWYPTFVNFISKGETIEIEDFSTKVDGIKYHQKSIEETSTGYNYTYKYTYGLDEYYDSYAIANAFIETKVHEGNDTLVLKTSKENLLCQYDYFESAKVNITIDPKVYKLNYTNTSNKNNNTYTWFLDSNNCDNSEIILTLDKVKKSNNDIIEPNDNPNDNNEKKKDYTIYIFYIILIVIMLIGYLIFKKIKLKNENFELDD